MFASGNVTLTTARNTISDLQAELQTLRATAEGDALAERARMEELQKELADQRDDQVPAARGG